MIQENLTQFEYHAKYKVDLHLIYTIKEYNDNNRWKAIQSDFVFNISLPFSCPWEYAAPLNDYIAEQLQIESLGLWGFNATFNNISVMSWWLVLLVEETTDLS